MQRFDSVRWLASLVAAVVLAACGVTDPTNDERDRLNSARDRWNDQAIVHYTYRYTNQCGECLPEFSRAYDVRVENEVITDVRDAETGDAPPDGYEARTVPALFALVQDAIDQRADVLLVDYHPQLGYPTLVSIDYRFQTPDDEFTIRVDALTPLSLEALDGLR